MAFNQGNALLIGVNSYENALWLNKDVAMVDAGSVAEVLRNPQYCGYPSEQVQVINGAGATRSGILQALDHLAERTRPEDTVVIFHVGHGDYGTDNMFNLICHDLKIEGSKVVAGTGVNEKELLEKIKGIPAERLLLIFNTCHSGNISPTFGAAPKFGDRIFPGEAATALLATGSGRVIITACREDQLSYIGGGKLSIFTQALVDSLQGEGVIPRGGFISVFDLYAGTFDRVSQIVFERFETKQEPELTVLKGVGPMAVALFQGAKDTTLSLVEEETAPPQGKAVRWVEQEQSDQLYQKIVHQTGEINISDSEFKGDVIYAQGSQGLINRPAGPVYQHIGNEIHTGGGANISGTIKIESGDFVGGNQYNYTKGMTGDEVARLFSEIYARIETHPQLDVIDKSNLTENVQDIQKEVAKGDQANETFLERRLRSIKNAAPDILDVVLATLTNPAAGFATVARKVAEKMKTGSQ